MQQPSIPGWYNLPPCARNLPTLQILYNTGETRPHTYYGLQNDSQGPFHQSRKPVSVELGFQVGIHDVSFAGRAESEKVRTSYLHKRDSNSSAAPKAGFVLEESC